MESDSDVFGFMSLAKELVTSTRPLRLRLRLDLPGGINDDMLLPQRVQPTTPTTMRKQGIHVFMGSLWTCATIDGQLTPSDYEEINLRSMALDSELNVLSQAQDLAFRLRGDLFSQCNGDRGPAQFANMEETFKQWREMASNNFKLKKAGLKLTSQLLPFHVDREPGSPVV